MREKESGFTFIEIIVVMVIFSFSVMAAVGIYTLATERLVYMEMDGRVVAEEYRLLEWLKEDVRRNIIVDYHVKGPGERLVFVVVDEGMEREIVYERRTHYWYREDRGLRTEVSGSGVSFEKVSDGRLGITLPDGGTRMIRVTE